MFIQKILINSVVKPVYGVVVSKVFVNVLEDIVEKLVKL
jgi:hypothetical protein